MSLFLSNVNMFCSSNHSFCFNSMLLDKWGTHLRSQPPAFGNFLFFRRIEKRQIKRTQLNKKIKGRKEGRNNHQIKITNWKERSRDSRNREEQMEEFKLITKRGIFRPRQRVQFVLESLHYCTYRLFIGIILDNLFLSFGSSCKHHN